MRMDAETGVLRPTGGVTHIVHALFVAALPSWQATAVPKL
jgi:hypothetical protein